MVGLVALEDEVEKQNGDTAHTYYGIHKPAFLDSALVLV